MVKMEMEIEMGEHQGKQLLSLPSSPGRLSYRMRVTFVVLQLPGNLMLGNEEQHPGEMPPLLQFLSPSPPLCQPGRAVRYRCSGCALHKADIEELLWGWGVVHG